MKNFTPKLKFGLRYLKEIICMVGYLTKYNKHWDEHVNRCINEGVVDWVDEYTISFMIDGARCDLWIGNPFYSYAHPRSHYPLWARSEYRPSIATMFKLDKLIKEIR